MHKTLHKTFSKNNTTTASLNMGQVSDAADVTELTHSMRGFLQQAAADVLQPRAEMIKDLLKKINAAQ